MEITKQDLRDQTKELKEYVAERVGRVEGQLLRLNGQVGRHDRELGAHNERIKNLEYAAEPAPGEDGAREHRESDDEKPLLTKRDFKVLAGVAGGIVGIVEVAHRVFDFMMKVKQ